MQSCAPLSLRPATHEDSAFLEALYFEVHRDEFAPLQLPDAQLLPLLQMQARAQRQSYQTQFPHAADQIVLAPDGAASGRLLVDRQPDAMHLVDIALLADARNAGLGTALLKDLIAQATALAVPLRLQVRPGNRAFHLYTRLGFRLVSGGMSLEMEFTPPHLTPAAAATASAPDSDHPAQPWEVLIGTSFNIATEPPNALPPLLLTRVERSAAPRAFALYFAGPPSTQLGQGTFFLQPGTVSSEAETQPPAEPSPLFLVPIAATDRATEYEAIFN